SVYYALGALFGSFMLGLALGTWWVGARARRVGRWAGAVALGVMVGGMWWTVYGIWPGGTALATLQAMVLNMVAGGALGAFVALAAWDARSRRGGGAVVYAADLSGAVVGAVLFSVVVPPALGFGVLVGLMTVLLLGMMGLIAAGSFSLVR
ncbi:MAG: hypothetical protein N2595_01095, partial [bacterium]|nr:hypothetical protein [bacterium]